MKYLKGSNKEKRKERVRAYPWSISRPLFKLFLFSCSYRSCSCCRRSSSRSRAMRSASLRRSWETRRPHSELKCNIKNIQTTLNFSQKPNYIHLFLWATAPARYGLSLFPASPAPGAPSPASVSPSPVSVAPAAGSLVLLAPAWYERVHGVHVQQFLDALKKKKKQEKKESNFIMRKANKTIRDSFLLDSAEWNTFAAPKLSGRAPCVPFVHASSAPSSSQRAGCFPLCSCAWKVAVWPLTSRTESMRGDNIVIILYRDGWVSMSNPAMSGVVSYLLGRN